MNDKKPVEKQAERDSVYVRINPIYTNTVDALYSGWGFNYRNDFYVQAIKDAIDRQVGNRSRFRSDDDIDESSLNELEISDTLLEMKDLIVSMKESNEQSFKLLALLSTYAVMASSGYLVFINKERINEELKNAMKNKLNEVGTLDLKQLLTDLLDQNYDGFKNSVHH